MIKITLTFRHKIFVKISFVREILVKHTLGTCYRVLERAQKTLFLLPLISRNGYGTYPASLASNYLCAPAIRCIVSGFFSFLALNKIKKKPKQKQYKNA